MYSCISVSLHRKYKNINANVANNFSFAKSWAARVFWVELAEEGRRVYRVVFLRLTRDHLAPGMGDKSKTNYQKPINQHFSNYQYEKMIILKKSLPKVASNMVQ